LAEHHTRTSPRLVASYGVKNIKFYVGSSFNGAATAQNPHMLKLNGGWGKDADTGFPVAVFFRN
jgi:hypothetical protein|tara:strand:- start:83 stop:274 length:192 start_codon:yes stop_codon:yes gene_type:complete